MTDTELYQIVKDHREAWPEHAAAHDVDGETMFIIEGGGHASTVRLMFEASFHRELLTYTYFTRVEKWPDMFKVIVKHEEFEAPSLIEAYAKALEWLK